MNTRGGGWRWESPGGSERGLPLPARCDFQVWQNCQRLQMDEKLFVQMQQGHLRFSLSYKAVVLSTMTRSNQITFYLSIYLLSIAVLANLAN